MQAAVPAGEGAMAAIIGLDDAGVQAACEEASEHGPCQIANDNGGGQIVISGGRQAVEAAADIAKANGAKLAKLLAVSAPFHSSLMAPAADAMAEALANVRVSEPMVPVIANVTVAPATGAEAIVNTLVKQVTGQVRWRETVQWLAAQGVTHLVEAGSGKVLTA